jgi:hypothetical protein
MANMNMKWEDASLEERQAVVDCYNMYYNDEPAPLSFDWCNSCWTGSRWFTIKYTFGVAPY